MNYFYFYEGGKLNLRSILHSAFGNEEQTDRQTDGERLSQSQRERKGGGGVKMISPQTCVPGHKEVVNLGTAQNKR